MTTSMITTVTTVMTNVVVAPSLEGLLVGCMQLTGTVAVKIIAPSLLVGCRLLQNTEVTSPLIVNCVLLLTGTVPVVEGEVVPIVWRGEVVSTVCGGEVVPTV